MAQLTSTTVTGNLAVTGTIVANQIINDDGTPAALPSGGTNGQFLRVDSNGNPTWATVPAAEEAEF